MESPKPLLVCLVYITVYIVDRMQWFYRNETMVYEPNIIAVRVCFANIYVSTDTVNSARARKSL